MKQGTKTVVKNPYSPDVFSEILFERMKAINAALDELELYEFRYGLNNLSPQDGGWESIALDKPDDLVRRINSEAFYAGIKLKRYNIEIKWQ